MAPKLKVGQSLPLQSLLHCLRTSKHAEEMSDLTIICGADVHKVHKLIVFGQSSVLASYCRQGTSAVHYPSFITGINPLTRSQESLSGIITLPVSDTNETGEGDQPSIIAAMIKFMYGYDSYARLSVRQGYLSGAAKLYVTADKYDVKAMKDDILGQIGQQCESRNMITECDERDSWEDYPRLLRYVYDHCPQKDSPLKVDLMDWLLFERTANLKTPEMHAIRNEIPDINVTLVDLQLGTLVSARGRARREARDYPEARESKRLKLRG